MSTPSELDPVAVRKTLIDFVAVPVIALYGLLSLGPIGGLLSGSGGVFRTIVNCMFLATSLWGVLALVAALRWLASGDYASRIGRDTNRVYLALFAGIWSIFYMIFLLTPR